jgi:hypothetical protein
MVEDDGRLSSFQSKAEESLGLITSEKTTMNTFVFVRQKRKKVVKSLVRTDDDEVNTNRESNALEIIL